jgi:hypothetical protein
MGQQQLLLVILVTIIVGIATMVAINTMQAAHDESVYQAIQQDILQAQSQSIGYINKPAMFGGGSGSYAGMTLDDILLPESNENAEYELQDLSPASFTILATSSYGFTVSAVITGENVVWERTEIDTP